MEQTQQPTILIVDDRQSDLDALRDYLRIRGLRISVATGGEQALKRVRQHPPALILLDVFCLTWMALKPAAASKQMNMRKTFPSFS